MNKTLVKKLMVCFMSTVVTVSLLEAGARVYSWIDSKGDVSWYTRLHPFFNDHITRQGSLRNSSNESLKVYYFGGSTIQGEPYSPDLSIPYMVGQMIGPLDDGRETCHINLGLSGLTARGVLANIKEMLRQRSQLQPALVVIYSGHNEFLPFHEYWGLRTRESLGPTLSWCLEKSALLRTETSRTILGKLGRYKLEIDDRQLFDEPLFELDRYDAVIREYCQTLDEAITLLQSHKIPVIVSTVAANYADWEPNRSVYSLKNTSDLAVFKDLLTLGQIAAKGNELDRAIYYCEQALALSGEFAECHFLLGTLYRKQGRYEKAWDSFLKAVDLDRMPIRGSQAQNSYIRRLAFRDSVYVVDSVAHLRRVSPEGLIGFDLMADAHHPNIKGYLLISELISNTINAIVWKGSHGLNSFTDSRIKERAGFGREREIALRVSMGKWFYRLATWRYASERRLTLSEDQFIAAIGMTDAHCDPYLGLSVVNYLRKDLQKAEQCLFKAGNIDRNKVSDFLRQRWIRQVRARAASHE